MRQRCGPVVPMWRPTVLTRCSKRWATAAGHFSDEGVCYIFESLHLGAIEPSFLGWNRGTWGGLLGCKRLSEHSIAVVPSGHGGRIFSDDGVSYIFESPLLGAIEPSFLGWNRGTWGGLMSCKRLSIHSSTVVLPDHGGLITHRAGKFDKVLICRPWTHDTISTRWCRPNLGSKAKSWGCNVCITLLGYCGSLRDRGCGVYRPYSGKFRPECSSGHSATLWAGKMVEPSFLGWNRGTWGGLMGCKRLSVHSIMVVPSDHCGLMTHRAGKFDKIMICRPWTHDTISTRWCRPNLGSKAKSWGCNVSLTLLGYCGSLWDPGCGVYRPCSGKFRSKCSSGYSATLWAGKLVKVQFCMLELNVAALLAMWCTLGCSYVMTHDCGSNRVMGCSMAPIRDQVCMVALTKVENCVYFRYSILRIGPMVEIFLPPMGDKRVKDRPGNSSRGCNLDFTKNRTCGSDRHCLWETVLLDWDITVFSSKIEGCWALNVKLVLSLVEGKTIKNTKVINWVPPFFWNQSPGGREFLNTLLLSLILAEPFLWVTLMEDSSKTLVQQMEGLRFTEEELQVVDEIEALGLEPVQGEERWVVGKLVSPRIVDGHLLIRIYFSVWKNQPLEEATSLGPNMFLFKFKREEDKDFFLGRCPWTVDGELLALKPFDKLLSPKDYDFHPLPIWIRIYDVPLGLMSSKVGEAVGNKFGTSIATDLRDENGCSGEYLRVRVEIDSSKPLKRCTVLGRNKKSGQPRVCMVKYERLPKFCFYCGIIGHESRLCPVLTKGEKPTFQFGYWLRVELPKSNDLVKRKMRPMIVYVSKDEASGSGQNLKGTSLEATGENDIKLGEEKNEEGIAKDAAEGNGNSLIIGTNQGSQLITPRPKIKNAKRSLKGKVEANCSKKAKKAKSLSYLKSDESAFVGGRLISDNVIVANKLFHYLKGSKNGSNKWATIKLDMEKAYDRVEWHFLSNVMAKMGFDPRWIDTVMNCVATVSYCFKINGVISDPFRPSRGLRQGDPLSPYLFMFCTQGLLACLIKEQREGRIRGIRASQNGPRVNHLLYADDCILFTKNSEKEAMRLKHVLEAYESSSGQKINVEKSSIFFSNGINDQSKAVMNSILNMREDAVLGQYLGLPLIVGKSKVEAFGFLDEKVQKRMGNWTKNLLSFAGREVFIKSMAQGIPAYAMSCFLLPECIINPMVATIRKFC
ncbi:hypothetical protein GQ457_16G014760 [Hibiscus cannabinus]